MFELRPYQKECLEKIDAAKERGVYRPLVVWPCGAGKTCLFSSVIKSLFESNPASRALVLAHRDELIQQARDKLLTVWPGAAPLVGVVKAEQNDVASKITVASVQSLYQTARLEAYLRHGMPELTVTDEAHHAAGGRTYRRIYETLSLLPGQDTGGRMHLGVTATPDRLDKIGLKHVFDEVIHALTIGFMIESGYLVPVRGVLVNVGFDLDGAAVNSETGDFSDSSLARVMESPAVVEAIARAWVEKGENRKTVAFAPSVRMAGELAEALRGMGVAAAFVSGDTPEHERRELLRQFSDGEIRVLANCMVLTEGFDCPDIECILMARPTKSRALYQQAVGRGLRPAPWAGKADCLVLDVVGNSLKHKLVTVASLEGKEPGAAPETSERASEESGLKSRQMTLYAGTEKVVGLITGFGWLKMREDLFALYASDRNVAVLVRKKGDTWQALAKDFNVEGMAGVQVLSEGPDRGYVFGAAENYAAVVGDSNLLREDREWRNRPPSEAQVSFLERMAARRGLRDFVPPATRGEASDLITKWRLEELLAPPTEKQVYALKRAGLWEPGLTKIEASRRIVRLKKTAASF
ncbi:DEAD/DEAH box helicase [Desulfofundulus thermosubterraneus]|uniref:Helicase conserved C-terminal domain-containing protein n=1 Tax=Desulfofundulus thermosubterraneus DSM 16057 TaxID=1121432 RepID=A0A1M6JHA2_9FIRM|nr:DEAD/DEAH box helicase [Desulfofundulus thermosubterraneus]SHJ46056.1 Helicase conserved C-terminal domain-containing protein [Desulfofundulus thermosubterraneus DSM 16057]